MIQPNEVAATFPIVRRGRVLLRSAVVLVVALGASCGRNDAKPAATPGMTQAEVLRGIAAKADDDPLLGEGNARRARMRVASLPKGAPPAERYEAVSTAAEEDLRVGRIDEAVRGFGDAIALIESFLPAYRAHLPILRLRRGVAELRRGEVENCCTRYTPESCVFPIKGRGVHAKTDGSKAAIRDFSEVLRLAAPGSDEHWTARWLLNVAHMTLGTWPAEVPQASRLEPYALGDRGGFPRFANVASACGIDDVNLSGGVAADDLDGDGFVDVVLSDWHPSRPLRLYRNLGNGRFVERGAAVGFGEILGGLNIVPNDYDGDGDTDLLVLRGAWLAVRGRQPVSLLRNDGGAFKDVTAEAGLAHALGPSQTAAFADFDCDGDVDFYMGVEAQGADDAVGASRLYRNEGGRFVDVAKAAGVENMRFAKGVAWGDVDADGDPDLYVSNFGGDNRLYRNAGNGTFVDVAPQVGVTKPRDGFPCWFFDADQDGNLDLFAAAFFRDAAPTAAAYFGKPDPERYCRIYKGDGAGGFDDVTHTWGATRVVPVMGSSYGDLDNDGAPDVYLATGAPDYAVLTPNVMYLNSAKDGIRRFRDVTVAGEFGILQKGHAVAFADFDGDGDQDVFTQTGGAYGPDGFRNALFENPGFAGTNRLVVRLRGTKANGVGYGARVRAEVEEGGVIRNVYAFVGCCPSFGGNPLAAWLGLGKAEKVRLVEITWPKPSGLVQVVRDVPLMASIEVTEGAAAIRTLAVPRCELRRE